MAGPDAGDATSNNASQTYAFVGTDPQHQGADGPENPGNRAPVAALGLIVLFTAIPVVVNWALIGTFYPPFGSLLLQTVPYLGTNLSSILYFVLNPGVLFLVFYLYADRIVIEGNVRPLAVTLFVGGLLGAGAGTLVGVFTADAISGTTLFSQSLFSATQFPVFDFIQSGTLSFLAAFSGLAIRHFVKLESLLGLGGTSEH